MCFTSGQQNGDQAPLSICECVDLRVAVDDAGVRQDVRRVPDALVRIERRAAGQARELAQALQVTRGERLLDQ